VLFDLKRGAEARALIDRRLAARPGDATALRQLAESSARAGRYDEAERAYARMAEAGLSEQGDLNNRAWAAVLRGAVDDAATEWARQGAQGADESAPLHTLATVYAERGRVKEALQVLGQSVAASSADDLRGDDWYVVGRAAEGCGLLATARAAYARVKPAADGRLDATHVLATRRLAGLASAGRAAARQ
jgi:tetratricopeptide (TPR) repeat protein